MSLVGVDESDHVHIAFHMDQVSRVSMRLIATEQRLTEVSMGRSVLAALGAWASAVQLEDVPAAAVVTAKRSILDCIGVTIGALREPIAGVIDKYLDAGEPGSASVVGRTRQVGAEAAALANGALAHALDFDDVSHTMGGHPTIPVLWSSLAVAETLALTGADLLRAYCVGVEIETAIGRGLNFHHYDKGWHPTGTLGTFGGSAAVASLRRLDAAQTTAALGYATATAAGIKASFGTMAKPLQVGRAASSGVLNAALAAAGATMNENAMEAAQGFANVYNGEGTYDLEAMVQHLANPWDLVDPGIAIKLHPCCGGTHAAVDTAISIHRGLGSAGEIVKIDAYIHRRRLAHLDRPHPANPLDAKFSLQHTVALALLRGVIRMGDFTDDAIGDQELVTLRNRVRVHPLPPEREGSEHFAAEVHVQLGDGTEREARMERPRGRTPETALTDDDITSKFRVCTETVLDRDQQDQVIAFVGDLENRPRIEALTALLRTHAERSGAGIGLARGPRR